jgi:hypothetical protein
MATVTPRRNTPRARPPMPTGRRNMPRPRPTAKPKTTREWLDRKFAPKKYRTTWGWIFGNLYKGVRGVSRVADRRAERVRERKRARVEMREHTLPPTWGERIRMRREREKGPANQCLACGKSLTREQMRDHVLTCGTAAPAPAPAPAGSAAVPKPKKAKAVAAAPVAPAPVPAATPSAHPTRAELDDEVRQWKRERAAYRKANMTRRARAADVARRGAVRFAGYGGKCRTCGMNLTRSGMAAHRCGGAYHLDSDPTVPTPAAPVPAPTPVPSAPAAPAAGPSTAAPSTTNGKEAPVAFGRGTGTSNGSTQTGGGGNSSAYAQQILQAMQAWSQDIPKTHTEMGANMQAMSTMCTTMSQLVGEFQNRLINKPPGPNGEPRGFHPSTVAPLSGPAQRFAEASAGFTETFIAISRYYQVLIDMHQSGTPVPDANYLRG